MIGQLKQTALASTSRDNRLNNAMMASLTQRSHNLAATATDENDSHVRSPSQRKPLTARCGSTLINNLGQFGFTEKSLVGTKSAKQQIQNY